MTMTKAQRLKQEQARDRLREMLQPGDTVWTVLRHVSRSGMSRYVDVYVIRDNSPMRITWRVADAIGYPYSQRWEAVETYSPYDVVHSLGYALYGIEPTPETPRGGGYAFRHETL